MKIKNGDVEIEIYPEEMRHFKLNNAKQVKSFIQTVAPAVEKSGAIGFTVQEGEEDGKS